MSLFYIGGGMAVNKSHQKSSFLPKQLKRINLPYNDYKRKLTIFDKYKGDNDAFVRSGRNLEHNKIDDADWSFIEQAYSDIYLINANRAATVYVEEAISKLKSNCDQESFDLLYKKIIGKF